MKEITFIHAADLHLGSRFIGFRDLPQTLFDRLSQSGYRALNKLVTTALTKQVDFVIISGDVYDEKDYNLQAQVTLQREMARLNDNNIPVYIIYGNHDFVEGTIYKLNLPANVHIFDTDVESKLMKTRSGVTVELCGFSYKERNISIKMIDKYKKRSNSDYCIGILHGNFFGGAEHYNYAPFGIEDLHGKNIDYWALGHIHKQKIINTNPMAVYPGNLFGRTSKEAGDKGYYLTTISGVQVSSVFCVASDVLWQNDSLSINYVENFAHLVEQVQNFVMLQQQEGKGILLKLSLDFSKCQTIDYKIIDADKLLSALKEEEIDATTFVWVYKIDVILPKRKNYEHFIYDLEAFADGLKVDEVNEMVESLIKHNKGRHFVSFLDDKTAQELVQEAKLLLLNEWYGD